MYTFLDNENIIYDLQFGFRQQYFTSHILINITENIRKALDNRYYHFGIHGVSNDWFKSYLSNRYQYVSINGYESGLAAINYSVPQGSVLGPLLFLLYINDLNQAIKCCKIHHFTDDTNVSVIQSRNWTNKSMLT